MKKIITFAAALAASLCISISVFGEVTAPETINFSTMKMSWSDEFNGTALDRTVWTPQIGNGNAYGVWEWGNNEKQNYRTDNVTVSDGTLKIKAQYEQTTYQGTTYYYTSGRITSSGGKNIGLGYVEAKIKVPSSQGIWPAFWMLGTNGKTWPSCGEIDILEAFNTNTVLQSTIHYPSWSGKDVYKYLNGNKGGIDKTEWHTYGCYRDGNVCAFYIDGKLTGKYSTADIESGTNAGQLSVLNDDYYMLFNVACGGNLAGGLPPSDPNWSVTMEVDYVRYYVNKTAAELAAEATTKAPEQTTTKASAPKKAVISKLENVKGKKMKITLKKITGVKGYQIRYCDNKKFQGYEVKNTTKRSVVIKHLTKKETYWVKARAYKKSGKTKLWGKWSTAKKVTIKK